MSALSDDASAHSWRAALARLNPSVEEFRLAVQHSQGPPVTAHGMSYQLHARAGSKQPPGASTGPRGAASRPQTAHLGSACHGRAQSPFGATDARGVGRSAAKAYSRSRAAGSPQLGPNALRPTSAALAEAVARGNAAGVLVQVSVSSAAQSRQLEFETPRQHGYLSSALAATSDRPGSAAAAPAAGLTGAAGTSKTRSTPVASARAGGSSLGRTTQRSSAYAMDASLQPTTSTLRGGVPSAFLTVQRISTASAGAGACKPGSQGSVLTAAAAADAKDVAHVTGMSSTRSDQRPGRSSIPGHGVKGVLSQPPPPPLWQQSALQDAAGAQRMNDAASIYASTYAHLSGRCEGAGKHTAKADVSTAVMAASPVAATTAATTATELGLDVMGSASPGPRPRLGPSSPVTAPGCGPSPGRPPYPNACTRAQALLPPGFDIEPWLSEACGGFALPEQSSTFQPPSLSSPARTPRFLSPSPSMCRPGSAISAPSSVSTGAMLERVREASASAGPHTPTTNRDQRPMTADVAAAVAAAAQRIRGRASRPDPSHTSAPAAPRGKQCLEGSLQLMQSLEQWRKPMFLVDGTVQHVKQLQQQLAALESQPFLGWGEESEEHSLLTAKAAAVTKARSAEAAAMAAAAAERSGDAAVRECWCSRERELRQEIALLELGILPVTQDDQPAAAVASIGKLADCRSSADMMLQEKGTGAAGEMMGALCVRRGASLCSQPIQGRSSLGVALAVTPPATARVGALRPVQPVSRHSIGLRLSASQRKRAYQHSLGEGGSNDEEEVSDEDSDSIESDKDKPMTGTGR